MMRPGRDRARVEHAKITDYLLSLSYPDGRCKAAFSVRFGCRTQDREVLTQALRAVALRNPASAIVESGHGTRYTEEGPIHGPDGRTLRVRRYGGARLSRR